MPNGRTGAEGEGRKRQRNALACKRCRQRKIKCENDDGNGCQACRSAHGVDKCDYLRVNSSLIGYLASCSTSPPQINDYYSSQRPERHFNSYSGAYDPPQMSFGMNESSQSQYPAPLPLPMGPSTQASSQPLPPAPPFSRPLWGDGSDQGPTMNVQSQGDFTHVDGTPSWYDTIAESEGETEQLWPSSSRYNQAMSSSNSDYNSLSLYGNEMSSHYNSADVSPKTRDWPQAASQDSMNVRGLFTPAQNFHDAATRHSNLDSDFVNNFARSNQGSNASTMRSSSVYSESLRGSQSSAPPSSSRLPQSSSSDIYSTSPSVSSGFDQTSRSGEHSMNSFGSSRWSHGAKQSMYRPYKVHEDSYSADSHRIGKPNYRRLRPSS